LFSLQPPVINKTFCFFSVKPSATRHEVTTLLRLRHDAKKFPEAKEEVAEQNSKP